MGPLTTAKKLLGAMNSHRVFSSTLLVVVLLHAAAVCLTSSHKNKTERPFIGTDYYLTYCGGECTPGGKQCSQHQGCSCVFINNTKQGHCYKVNETDITDWDSFEQDLNKLNLSE
uniref:Secreted protein n=1 Tax=Amblyomma americanum TaxID=6943 RepID=A0A0C9RWB3_AMBAM